MIGRCIVCGTEFTYRQRMTYHRETSTGALVPGRSPVAFVFADGPVVGSCTAHTEDEARTAFVLAERTLRRVPREDLDGPSHVPTAS